VKRKKRRQRYYTHASISVSAEAYERIVLASLERGVSMEKLVEQACAAGDEAVKP
jgi:hypothetical protein